MVGGESGDWVNRQSLVRVVRRSLEIYGSNGSITDPLGRTDALPNSEMEGDHGNAFFRNRFLIPDST